MLSQDDRQRLKAIEAALRTDDPRFADAMGAWRPCPPREYRRRGLRLVLMSLLVTLALVVAGVAGVLLA